ncbi:unnamed protein product [Eruca vesicaria subsp. sativa]|uniref:Uncharacterized protein n=1 Tax=Eruca vesicaria subsp. sativa TaxID=29727 RepID=A0ABC8IU08_ERUVS|nr:unnamed protein product [Eruca vesicaria subsp. sativa]
MRSESVYNEENREAPINEDMLPEMMFAAGEEPIGVRVLTYQSSRALKCIVNSLDEEEKNIILNSSFGKMLEIAEKPLFSGRFAENIGDMQWPI